MMTEKEKEKKKKGRTQESIKEKYARFSDQSSMAWQGQELESL